MRDCLRKYIFCRDLPFLKAEEEGRRWARDIDEVWISVVLLPNIDGLGLATAD